jgi:hypothetical protein
MKRLIVALFTGAAFAASSAAYAAVKTIVLVHGVAQNGHLSVPAERHRPRRATLRHTVVEKLVMDPSPGTPTPRPV